MADLPVYLDHHSTTPCDPRVVERMLPYFSGVFGNPAAVTHPHGRKAATALEEARGVVAGILGVRPPEVYFTSGATESNNTVIRSFATPGSHVITTAVEHKSVLAPMTGLRDSGVDVTILEPDSDGFVTAEQVRGAIRSNTRLVSVMAANGEIGTLEPVAEIAAVCAEAGVPLHSDATQAIGKIPLDLSTTGCSMLSLSAHKFYGPKGVGCLIVRRGVRLSPLLVGGGQEKGFRSGTVNVAGAVGLAEALAIRGAEMAAEAARLTAMRNRLWDRIVAEVPDSGVHGPRELRLPGNLSAWFGRTDAESLMHAMRHFSLSSGSACSSGDREPSHVLLAIGASVDRAMSSIRFGLGKGNTEEEIDLLVDDLKKSVSRVREMSA
jgi:cysteine desulfurase